MNSGGFVETSDWTVMLLLIGMGTVNRLLLRCLDVECLFLSLSFVDLVQSEVSCRGENIFHTVLLKALY